MKKLALCAVLLMACPQREAALDRAAASALIQDFLRAQDVRSEGLNPQNLGGADLFGHRIAFEYQPDEHRLLCRVPVYTFTKPPEQKLLDAFAREQSIGTDTGGGDVKYDAKAQTLHLLRVYQTQVPAARFRSDMERLLKAGARWEDKVLDDVATKVYHPEELQ